MQNLRDNRKVLGLDSSGSDSLHLAVVGHTNVGKTSFIRTLTRQSSFGKIRNEAGTTREVERLPFLLLSQNSQIGYLYDTPGLEDAPGLLEEHFSSNNRFGRKELVRRFLEHSDSKGEFEQEAKVLRQLLESTAALYIVNTQELPNKGNREGSDSLELELLQLTSTPIIPVLNFVSSKNHHAEAWERFLRNQGYHIIIKFDTVLLNEDAETKLFESLKAIIPASFKPLMDQLIEDRIFFKDDLISQASVEVAKRILYLGSFAEVFAREDQTAKAKALRALRKRINVTNEHFLHRLLHLFYFDPAQYDEVVSISIDEVLNSAENVDFPIFDGGVIAIGAAVLLSIGVALDIAIGGFPVFSPAGAALGALYGVDTKTVWRRINLRRKGQDEWMLSDNLLEYQIKLNIVTVRYLLCRGHGAINLNGVSFKNLPELKVGKNTKRLIVSSRRIPDKEPAKSAIDKLASFINRNIKKDMDSVIELE